LASAQRGSSLDRWRQLVCPGSYFQRPDPAPLPDDQDSERGMLKPHYNLTLG